ncbi:hypothetical protein [Halapricum desulfuricans]|nr:hypothetical protein [Halapricum desulfuricans]
MARTWRASGENTKGMLTFLADEIRRETYVNLMDQYRPRYRVRTDSRYEEIGRRVRSEEFRECDSVRARELGLRLA